MRNVWHLTCALALFAGAVHGADTAPPVTERFAAADVAEVPSFQRHVVPLFGRLGCNGRACHGSFQGRGGFRLSLFGYDFGADHDALFEQDHARVVAGKPDESLIVTKPTSDEEHEGGERYARGTWQHHLLAKWIEGGAKYEGREQGEDKLVSLEITPSEIVFLEAGAKVPLRVVAIWDDGSREDVTPLCRFTTNNEQIATVADDGMLTGGVSGDSHIVVSYDKAVVPVPVMRPVSDQIGDQYPAVPTPTRVDELVVGKLRKLGIVPSDLCDDSEFLRRVSLDLAGTLPTAAEAEAFLADTAPDKRARKIDELLGSPAYAAWWATKLCDFTGNNEQQLNNVSPMRNAPTEEWFSWIQRRVEQNVPYDRLVEGIVMSVSRQPGQSYREYCEQMSELYRDETKSFADQETMPYYWARREFRNSPERAISFAYAFLGTRIQCAQCHKHPFDTWSKQDFDDFLGFFTYVRAAQNGATPEERKEYQAMLKDLGIEGKNGGDLRRMLPELLREGKTIPFPEISYTPAPRGDRPPRRNAEGVNLTPTKGRVLGGELVELADYPDSRQPLMDWLRDHQRNPLFARAFVNRVWASYFNVGIVEPPDDMSLANPPSNEPLLEYLAQGFVDHGYDMHWVHREILNSRTYQLSWRPNDTNRLDERNFSRSVPRRLPAEVAYDALVSATASDKEAGRMLADVKGRAIAIPGVGPRQGGGNGPQYALQVFGRSTRESNCDCDRSMDATLLQTVFLQNDRDTLTMIERRGTGWVDQVTGRGAAAPEPANEDGRVRGLRANREAMAARLEKLAEKLGEDNEQVARLRKRVAQFDEQIAEATGDKPAAEPAAPGEGQVEKSRAETLVRQAYLRTLTRQPHEEELTQSLAYVESATDLTTGVRDLLWALVNTKEFIVNH